MLAQAGKGFRVQGLEGQGDLVSRLTRAITRVTTWVIGIIVILLRSQGYYILLTPGVTIWVIGGNIILLTKSP